MQDFVDHIAQDLQREIFEIMPISGGDINRAYRLKFSGQFAFLKCNTFNHGFEMLEAESKALKFINNSSTIRTPTVFSLGQHQDQSYMVLEYIEEEQPSAEFWQSFGRRLSQLHRVTNAHFGFETNNFIGSLPQINSFQGDWLDFFLVCRIEPQLKIARDRDLIESKDLVRFDFIARRGQDLFPSETPSLLHGDLWNGNFLIDRSDPVLIDPASYFGHREMDLAMTDLFGGFDEAFYGAYNDEFPLVIGWSNRLNLYQLYPLLVHLNLFGSAYLPAIQRILTKYS